MTATAAAPQPANANQPVKDLYSVGEIPPLGHVPARMHAWCIRQERHGAPDTAMQLEIVPTWSIGEDECLILVMAAGVNYNGVWAALGKPISPIDGHKNPYHIAGSDASGSSMRSAPRSSAGRLATRWSSIATRMMATMRSATAATRCSPIRSASGAMKRRTAPSRSSPACRPGNCCRSRRICRGRKSACYTLTLATAYRMLFGHRPHVLGAGQNVLVWGASGGLGSMAIQLIATTGANAIGVISDDDKTDFVMQLGAKGVINRKAFKCWGQMPQVGSLEYNDWMKSARDFGKAIWAFTGKGNNVDMVFEHPGEQTFPVSVLMCKRGGMVVICAGTSGFNLTMDARYLWMHQKRVQGSHFANLLQASAANKLVQARRIDPCMSDVYAWSDIPKAHMKMWKNEHRPGNMAVLVSAPTTGLKTLDDAVEAAK